MKTIKRIEWCVSGVIAIGQTPEPYRLTWQVFFYEPGKFQVFGPIGDCIHGDGGLDDGKAAAEKQWRAMALEDPS
jgi:hypothetical protein